MSATFRGHQLDGVKMKLPEGYQAVVLTEAKRPLSEDTERKFQVKNITNLKKIKTEGNCFSFILLQLS